MMMIILMVMSALSVCVAVTVMYLHANAPAANPPKWLSFLMFKVIARILCITNIPSSIENSMIAKKSESGNQQGHLKQISHGDNGPGIKTDNSVQSTHAHVELRELLTLVIAASSI